MPKKLPTTIEDCYAEIEKNNEQIRQYENCQKILKQKMSGEEQRIRT